MSHSEKEVQEQAFKKNQATAASTPLVDPLIKAPQDDLTEDKFVAHLLHLEPKDVNLKFVFDHLRNYGIAAGMAWAGVGIFSKVGGVAGFLDKTLDLIAAGSLLGLGVILFFLNFAHGVAAAAKLQKFEYVGKWSFTIVSFLIILIAVKLVFFAKSF
jgi:hypothetical protein